MKSQHVELERTKVESLLAGRKMSIDHISHEIELRGDKVILESLDKLAEISEQTRLPLSSFFEGQDYDLDDGIKISRRDQTFSRKEIRNGEHYYTYHHLATPIAEPSLMALRLDIACKNPEKIQLNDGHNSKELVYVTKGVVQVQWIGDQGSKREEVLNEGDSIFIWPLTPHSFTAIGSSDAAEIIAINYG